MSFNKPNRIYLKYLSISYSIYCATLDKRILFHAIDLIQLVLFLWYLAIMAKPFPWKSRQFRFVFDNANAIESFDYKFTGSLFVCVKLFIFLQASWNIEFMAVINIFAIPSHFRLHGKRKRYFRQLLIEILLNKMLQVEWRLHCEGATATM